MANTLDKKDRTIIKELFDDARKPYSEIAKSVRLSKEAVAYRVQRLRDSGALTGFNTIIDVRKLGWKMFFAYLQLHHVRIGRDTEIMDILTKNPHVSWQVWCIGEYDIILKLFAKDVLQANSIMKDIEASLQPSLKTYLIDSLVEDHPVPKTFLFPKEKRGYGTYINYGTPEQVEVSKLDRNILQVLAKNARISVTDLAVRLKVSRELAKYRLKRLEKEKVILKYRPEMWSEVQKDGWNLYFVMLKLGKLSPALERKLDSFIMHHGNVNFFYKTVGNSDLQIEIQTRTTIEFNAILMEIRTILQDTLKRYELLMILSEQKFTYFPECMVKHYR